MEKIKYLIPFIRSNQIYSGFLSKEYYKNRIKGIRILLLFLEYVNNKS